MARHEQLSQPLAIAICNSCGREFLRTGARELESAQESTRTPAITSLKSSTGLKLKARLDYHPAAADSAQIIFTRTDKRLPHTAA